ncbi:SRPBCC family protein [Nocardioides sp. W7]|uniref:SRPBCC family protein n=1 Tax=Nocardioides sp. W7 TaxID=2931390 RepID=UPI001FD271C5|nr:SRPBCC family protein [Nocardioides sp. W7]
MDLQHRFTVPTSVEETWAHFNDIASVAECFPGATVSSVDADTFAGSVKVKLGPIALVYNGSGRFVEKDEAAHRFVVEANGKDKRGNGTAGATVTLSMAVGADGTEVEVLTDLAITGKPAQFGRGVMQDVSDKLLGQFVACLEQRLSGPPAGAGGEAGGEQDTESASPTVDGSPPGRHAGEQSTEPAPATVDGSPPPAAAPPPRPAPSRPPPARAQAPDSVDLGAAVVPVLVKAYGNVVAAAVVGLLLGWLIGRRRG